MRMGSVGSLAALLVGTSLALAQQPPPPLPAPLPDAGEPVPFLAERGRWPWERDPAVDGEVLWFSGEYLLWWFKNSPLPVPLVTTTSRPDLVPTAAFNQDGTSVLLGGSNIDTGVRHGARFSGGLWIDDRRTVGLEGGYFFLASHTVTQGVNSNGQAASPILAIPFFDADAMAESSFVLASPGVLAGGAELSLTSRLQGAELNGVVETFSGDRLQVQVLAGFRFLDLTENLSFAATSLGIQDPGPGSNNGLVLNTLDQFNTRNTFYGGQVGARAEYGWGNLSLSASGKLAVGDSYQVANLNGFAVTNFFNAPAGGPFTGVPTQVLPGAGTFVQATNVGPRTRHVLTVAPELEIRAGYLVGMGVRVFVGYDLLVISNVLRPGNLIDRNINMGQTIQNAVAGNPTTTGTFPMINLHGREFWAQGITFGLEYRY